MAAKKTTTRATATATDPATKSTLEQYREQRLKKITFQNYKLQMELKRLQGEVGDIEKIKREVLAANQTVKQLFLAIPFRLAMQLASVTEPREIHTILEKAITEALNDLAYEREQH